MALLAPSILSADFANLGDNINKTLSGGADIVHIDVMDGIFVPSISFGMPVIKSIRKVTDAYFDVHLMIDEPIRYISEFKEAGADGLTIHVEACKNVAETLQKIKDAGMDPSLSLKPNTPLEAVLPYLDMVKMILVMSVEPGFGGQKLIPETLKKIRELKKIKEDKYPELLIEIDGGVNKDNIKGIAMDGADVIVAGSAVFKDDIIANTKLLKALI